MHRSLGRHVSHIRSLQALNWPPVLKEVRDVGGGGGGRGRGRGGNRRGDRREEEEKREELKGLCRL